MWYDAVKTIAYHALRQYGMMLLNNSLPRIKIIRYAAVKTIAYHALRQYGMMLLKQ